MFRVLAFRVRVNLALSVWVTGVFCINTFVNWKIYCFKAFLIFLHYFAPLIHWSCPYSHSFLAYENSHSNVILVSRRSGCHYGHKYYYCFFIFFSKMCMLTFFCQALKPILMVKLFSGFFVSTSMGGSSSQWHRAAAQAALASFS